MDADTCAVVQFGGQLGNTSLLERWERSMSSQSSGAERSGPSSSARLGHRELVLLEYHEDQVDDCIPQFQCRRRRVRRRGIGLLHASYRNRIQSN